MNLGTLEIHAGTTTGNGTVTSTGLTTTFHETIIGTCSFKTSATDIGTLTGSNVTKSNATLDLKGTLAVEGSNPFCGSAATWEGSFKVVTPSTLEVH